MATERAKEKIFRLQPGEEERLNKLIVYAYKTKHITKPSLQEFMRFSIECTYLVLKQDWEEKQSEETGDQEGQTRRKRPVI